MLVRGYVYVMTSKSFPGLVKVGFSLKEPMLRAVELSSTGVPHPFVVAYDVCVLNPKEVEQAVHRQFRKDGRHESKEFFRASAAEAIAKIKQVLITQNKTVLMENRTGPIAADPLEQYGDVTESKALHCPECGLRFSKGCTTCMYCRKTLVPIPMPKPKPIPISPFRDTTKRVCPKCSVIFKGATHCMYCKVKLI